MWPELIFYVFKTKLGTGNEPGGNREFDPARERAGTGKAFSGTGRERAGTGKAFSGTTRERAGTGKAFREPVGNGREPGKQNLKISGKAGTGRVPEIASRRPLE